MFHHPRKCFTHLFPWYQTKWLTFTIIAFTSAEMICLLSMHWNDPVVLPGDGWSKFNQAASQSISTRTAGFEIVNVAAAAPAMQVLWVIMMFIAAYPVALSIRNSSVVERVESESIFKSSDDIKGSGTGVFVQAKHYLSRDASYLFLILFVIAAVERRSLQNVSGFTLWALIFEIVSAYGTVGISLGTTYASPLAFSAQFHVVSKLLMCMTMLLGRHRGLPDSIDRAVQLQDYPKWLEQNKERKSPNLAVTTAIKRNSSEDNIAAREERRGHSIDLGELPRHLQLDKEKDTKPKSQKVLRTSKTKRNSYGMLHEV